jgi:hypothetical protein
MTRHQVRRAVATVLAMVQRPPGRAPGVRRLVAVAVAAGLLVTAAMSWVVADAESADRTTPATTGAVCLRATRPVLAPDSLGRCRHGYVTVPFAPTPSARPTVGQADQPSLVASPAPGGQVVQLRDFPGGDDRTRLVAAIAFATAQPIPPTIMLPADTRIDVSAGPITLRNGVRLRGGWTGAREFLRTVTVTGKGPMFQLQQGNGVLTRDVTIEGIAFNGSRSVDFLEPENLGRGPILAYSRIRDVAFNGFHTVMWGRMLGVIVDGDSYTNNSVATPWYLSGSDNSLWSGGGFVDSPNLADTDYLVRFGHMSKTYVGPVFVTGDGPTPVRVDGGRDLVLSGVKAESQGIPRRTAGAGILVTGGLVTLRDVWVYGVLNHASGPGHRGDRGMITVLGGDVLIDGPVFGAPDAGPADGAPVVFAGGRSHVIVSHARGEQRTLVFAHSPEATLTTG